MIKFIGAKNEQAYYAEYLLKMFTAEHTASDIRAFYPNKFLFKNIGGMITPGVSTVVILGLGFKKSEQEAFTESIRTSGNPKVRVYHFASWGDEMQRDEEGLIISKVSETESPLLLMHSELAMYEGMDTSQFTMSVVDAVSAYHRYDFIDSGQPALLYKAIADVYGVQTADVLISKNRKGYERAVDMLQDNVDMIRLETDRRNEYVRDRAETATVSYIGNWAVIMVYAESYVNELAMELMSIHEAEGTTGIVVLVGKHTRGGDMFSIRTTGDVSADAVAKTLGNHQGGKPQVAMVFLSRPLDAMSKLVTRQLLTIL